ncbi:unnamed protein product [Rotaria sordida]|uniref:Uncharacterized protein n=1 Tax=Rotaria sordida TaxID=392033 RepID=A0A814IM84_9BILA|nr:unnamed protein product [Rotaria sordida]
MMNTSITKTKENISYEKSKSSNHHRKERLLSIVQKNNDWLSKDLSKEMTHLFNSINNICHQQYVTLDDILNSSNSNSTLGKIYQLFLSLRNNKDNLLNEKIFENFILKKTQGLITKLNQKNKHSMNFIEFIKRIDLIAKENHLSKEYLYEKLLHRTFLINNQDQNNNALDYSLISQNLLLNEYNNDLSRLKNYFITHSEKSKDNSHYQMTCSTFIQCICQHIKLNKIDIRLQLNALFCQIQSSLVNQGLYIPASLTIDFHGFILCLQQIARTFNINLRILIKNLINT